MFATQHYMDVMMDPGRKRVRDGGEEDAGNGSMGFGEHRSKRIQCLPLRTSPKSSQPWQSSSSITPLNSDSDDHIPPSHFSPWSSSPAVSSQSQPHGAELDMMDSSADIQPGFAAQVCGQQCDWAGPGPAVTALTGVVNMGHHPSGFSNNQCVPRAMSSAADWQAVQNNRRLPSPISEAEYSTPAQGVGSPTMMMDDNNIPMTLEESPSAMHSSPPRAMDHPNAMMDIESPCQLHVPEPDGDASSPSPARRGHIRSKHTINNWTWQPGMKRSFSIGYRADCEKCRLKVPGHFNHIIVS